jgi:predicted TIM-barrel fold metal-dependent hydrolase
MTTFEHLRQWTEKLDVVDAHEHLCGEVWQLNRYLSFYDFIAGYLQWDLWSAGMDKSHVWNYPKSLEDEKRLWEGIRPFWHAVRHGSYARPVRLTLQHFFGCDDLTDETVYRIGEQMRSENKPGHFDKVFDQAGIRYVINQSASEPSEHPFDDPRFVYIRPMEYFRSTEVLLWLREHPGFGLEGLTQRLRDDLILAQQKGAKGAKLFPDHFDRRPDAAQAKSDLEELQADRPTDLDNLSTYLFDKTAQFCGELGLICCIHTGVWTDLNKMKPELIFPVVERHPGTTFDVYHMGMPYARAAGFLGKSYPNVHLNLCWAHTVSEHLTRSVLDEWIDYVPLNKILGFGGDIHTLPEHVWGQLAVAKDNLCAVMASRVDRGRWGLDDAKQVLQAWLWDNPVKLYQLK